MPSKSTTSSKTKNKKKKTPPPTKNKRTNCYYFADHPEFTPNLSPLEIIKQGAFGGTYFRPIESKVTKKKYHNRHLKYWSAQELKKHNIIPQKHLCLPFESYDKSLNKYNIRCGQTLEQWEGKNWITEHDPYGWFEWYCNFFQGRRLQKEDERQIKRWQNLASTRGRFMRFLVTQIVKKNAKWNDENVSPKIRQVLQHWGYKLTKKDFDNEMKRRKKL